MTDANSPNAHDEPGDAPEPQAADISGTHSATSFPVVGIAVSHADWDAARTLLGALPVDTGMAFIVVAHDPTGQPGQAAGILAGATTPYQFVASNPGLTCCKRTKLFVIKPAPTSNSSATVTSETTSRLRKPLP